MKHEIEPTSTSLSPSPHQPGGFPGVDRRAFLGGLAVPAVAALLAGLRQDVRGDEVQAAERSVRDMVRDVEEVRTDMFDWGRLKWLFSGDLSPGVRQTVGVCHILPGKRNPVHYHPNCDEVLYMISGRGEHSFNDEKIELLPGMAIHIPQDVRHNLINTGWESLTCLVTFSSPDRRVVFVEQPQGY